MLYGYVLSDGSGTYVVHISPYVPREVDHTHLVCILKEETGEFGMLAKKVREFGERNNIVVSNVHELGPELFPTPDEERDMLRKSVRDLSQKLGESYQQIAQVNQQNEQRIATEQTKVADMSALWIAQFLNKVIPLETLIACALNHGCKHLHAAYDEHCAVLEGENPLVFLSTIVEH